MYFFGYNLFKFYLIKWLTTINDKITVYKSISVSLAVCVDQVFDPPLLAVSIVYPQSDPNICTVKMVQITLFFAYF